MNTAGETMTEQTKDKTIVDEYFDYFDGMITHATEEVGLESDIAQSVLFIVTEFMAQGKLIPAVPNVVDEEDTEVVKEWLANARQVKLDAIYKVVAKRYGRELDDLTRRMREEVGKQLESHPNIS